MKRLLIMILSITILLVGCSNSKDNNNQDNNKINEEINYIQTKYDLYSEINNINLGLIVEDEEHLYYINPFGKQIYKLNKLTKEKTELSMDKDNIYMIVNLRIYNDKIYFLIGYSIQIGLNRVVPTGGAGLFSIEKDGSNLTEVINIAENVTITNLNFIDNYIYYDINELDQYTRTIKKKARYDLNNNTEEILEDSDCMYLYDNNNIEENTLLCINQERTSEIELLILNKETFEIEKIKTGIFIDMELERKPIYLDNTFYFSTYSYANREKYSRRIEKFDFITNQKEVVFNLENYITEKESKEVINGYVIKDNTLFITTAEAMSYYDNQGIWNPRVFYKLYMLKDNEVIILDEYQDQSYNTMIINLTEDYVVLNIGKDIKVFDYEGNEVDFMK